MTQRKFFALVLRAGLAAPATACLFQLPAAATPGNGTHTTAIGVGTSAAFTVERRDRDANGVVDWQFRAKVPQPLDITTVLNTFDPGGYSGWHSHPGPVYVTVLSGTLTVYEGTDPQCTPHTYTTGQAFVDGECNGFFHMAKNWSTDTPVNLVVTYTGPVGAATRIDHDDPNNPNCPQF